MGSLLVVVVVIPVTMALFLAPLWVQAFVPSSSLNHGPNRAVALQANGGGGGGGGENGLFQGFKNFFAELDAFVDDATARRLGNGAAFYGKRKSNFYGESDRMKKQSPTTPDPLEDYQGPSQAGYFQWQRDEDGQMRPVTRMKNKVIERSPKFWDRAFGEEDE